MLTRPEILSRLDEELNQIKVTAPENPAVARCARSWLLFYFEARMKGRSDDSARANARNGYRLSMPPFTGSRNVRDFIAGTTRAMLPISKGASGCVSTHGNNRLPPKSRAKMGPSLRPATSDSGHEVCTDGLPYGNVVPPNCVYPLIRFTG
jgi:hypothetical protein